jgi:hypothetical protein
MNMKTTISFMVALLFTCSALQAQLSKPNAVQQLVEQQKKQGAAFTPVELFSYRQQGSVPQQGKYHVLQLDETAANTLLAQQPATIRLKIPTGSNTFIETELVKISMGNTLFKTNNKQYLSNISKPMLYRGIVKNYNRVSSVSFTINKNFISFTASLEDKNYYVRADHEKDSIQYYCYNTSEIELPQQAFTRATKDPANHLQPSAPKPNTVAAAADKCVYVFVDCTYQFLKNSSYRRNVQVAIDRVYELYNDVGLAYQNEQINIKIATINVWTQADPFNHTNRDTALHDFAFYYQDDYWGNMAVQLDDNDRGISGIAAYIGKAKGELPNQCPCFNPNPVSPGDWWGGGPLCYCDLNYGGNYNNFPVPANSSQVYMIIHEMGHLLGSPHTHWCGWNLGNNTFGALDNCSATEGGCAAGPAPVNGGTFMSYCIGTGELVNFNNGFGPKPGTLIRDFVSNNSCINNCPSCAVDALVGNLNTGANHVEVSNNITANGILPAGSFSVLDGGNKVTLSPGFKAVPGANLKVVNNGCGGIQ